MTGQAELSKLHHCVYALHYHLVLVTKYRRRCLTAAMLVRFREIASLRCADWGGDLVEANGESDHVHLLVSMRPDLDLTRFVNNLKTTSSRLLRKEFKAEVDRFYRQPVLWSRSYCIVSCGGAPLSMLQQYIERQGEPG